MTGGGEPTALLIWQRLHWSFFVNVQGLFLSLSRFERALDANDLAAARAELASACVMMRASGASMELAGSFSVRDYADEVRPSMTPPEVARDDFSGLMSWDHSCLIQMWRRLSPRFATLPEPLHEAHEEFMAAYRALAASHRAVCEKFGGATGGSIRTPHMSATRVLESFERSRMSILDPRGRTAPRDPSEP